MRHPRTRIALTATVLVVTGLVLASPASANGVNYKVQIGTLSAGAGAQPFSAASSGNVLFASSYCSSSSVPIQGSNNITNSPNTNVLDLASIARLTFSGCTLSGVSASITQPSNSTWKLHATSGATNNATDTVNVHVDNIKADFDSPACDFTVTGFANGTYNESTKMLYISQTSSTSNLKASEVWGCGGTIVDGQGVAWIASYATNVANNSVLNIKP